MILFRRHDRYALLAMWTSLGGILVFLTAVVVLVHLADRGGRLVRNFPILRKGGHDPLMLTLEYYATMVPFVWLQVVPIAAAAAAALGLSRLTRHNEVAPLVTAGVSLRRFTLPLVISGVVLAGLLFLLQETLVPHLSRRHMWLDRLLGRHRPERITKVPHFGDPGGARLSAEAYEPLPRRLHGALVSLRAPDGALEELRHYPVLDWDEEGRSWRATSGGTLFALAEDPSGRVRRPLAPGARAPLEADVLLLEVSLLKDLALGMSTRETAALLAVDPGNPHLVLLHHQQFTRCAALVVLVLVGLPWCIRFGRTSALPGIVAVLASSAALYALVFLCARLATSGALNAVVMAWLPVVLLGAAGLATWLTMRS